MKKPILIFLFLTSILNAQNLILFGGSAPKAPTGLSATGASQDITLNWTDANSAKGYYICRDTLGTTPTTVIDTVLQGIQTYLDSGTILTRGIYSYRLLSYNNDGAKNYSSVATDTVNLDPEVIAYVASAGGGLGTTRVDTINTFVLMLKDSLSISLITEYFDRMWLLANTDTVSALNSFIYPDSTDAITISGMAFAVDRGFTGDGVADYINTNYNPNVNAILYSLNNASFGFYSRTDNQYAGVDMGIFDGSYYTQITARWTAPDITYIGIHSNLKTDLVGIANTLGLLSLSRTASANFSFYQNADAVVTASIVSATVPNYKFYIGARSKTTGVEYFTNRQYAFAFIGKGLTATEVRKLYNCVEWYLDAIGAGVIP